MTSRRGYQYTQQSRTVLLLTDGSDRAKRKAEWEGVFSDSVGTTVYHIDIIDCLDSGVFIRSCYRDIHNGEQGRNRSSTTASPYRAMAQNRGYTPEIDVLCGVLGVFLNYIVANGIDDVVICLHETSNPDRTFIGQVFATISRGAAVPVRYM